nr:helix-turn-helix domain-containing protein [Corynebacterium lactis]
MFHVQDLLLAEPLLRAVDGLPEARAEGLCRPGDGDPAGWLVLLDLTELSRSPLADGDTSSVADLLRTCRGAAALLCRCDSVPQSLRSEAVRARLPIIHVPPTVTPMRLITLVHELSADRGQSRAWRRLSALGTLAEALGSKAPEQSLLTKYWETTKNVGVVLSQDGEIVASVGELPVRTIERTVRGEDPVAREFHVGRWLLSAFPIEPEPASWSTGAGLWLVVGKRSSSGVGHVSRSAPVASALMQLLGVAARSRRQHSRAEQLRDSRVVSELVFGGPDPERLELQLHARGFPKDLAYRVVVAGRGIVPTDPGVAVEAVELAAGHNVPVIVSTLERAIVMITADPGASILDQILATLPSPVGVSDLGATVAAGPALYRQARVARASASLADETSGSSGWAHFTRCRPLPQAVGRLDTAALQAVAKPVDDRLEQTSGGAEFGGALVEEGFDVRAVAKRIHVHPNTVRNRVAALLGDGVLERSDLELWYFAREAMC